MTLGSLITASLLAVSNCCHGTMVFRVAIAPVEGYLFGKQYTLKQNNKRIYPDFCSNGCPKAPFALIKYLEV
jgi:hypothetical protein